MPITATRRTLLAGGATAALLAARNRRTENAEGTRLLPTDPTPVEKMERVLQAWKIAHELNYAESGASAGEIAEAELALGFALPDSMRTLYTSHDGGGYVGGNIQIESLLPHGEDTRSLVNLTQQLREWDWQLPPEILVFGGDGSDSAYGLWAADGMIHEPVVIEIGECFDPMCFTIVGDDLASFLTGRTAYYLLLYASDGFKVMLGLDVLEVPDKLLELDFDKQNDELYYGLIQWANPDLPDQMPDPYERPMTPAEINDFVANRDR
jgi:hypothetical protein